LDVRRRRQRHVAAAAKAVAISGGAGSVRVPACEHEQPPRDAPGACDNGTQCPCTSHTADAMQSCTEVHWVPQAPAVHL
jgi:hypothetical protein